MKDFIFSQNNSFNSLVIGADGFKHTLCQVVKENLDFVLPF